MKILIADDSEDNRFLVSAYLKNEPYALTFAENGQLAVDAFSAQVFDLVLMDMQMPVMDGLAAAAAIRALERDRSTIPIPIVALTANALVEDVERSRTAGCNAHLSKPIAKEKLVSAIESFRAIRPRGKTAPAAFSFAIPEGLEELSKNYIASRKQEVARMRQASPAEALNDLRVFGHNLKGTGSSFGFDELSRLGAAIEEAAKAANTSQLTEHLCKVGDYVEYASRALE